MGTQWSYLLHTLKMPLMFFLLQFLGTCKTTFDVENKKKGVDCIFPFYRPKDGTIYNGCVLSSGNSYWCTTKGILSINKPNCHDSGSDALRTNAPCKMLSKKYSPKQNAPRQNAPPQKMLPFKMLPEKNSHQSYPLQGI